MEDYLRVGVISSVHGVHGEVKAFPTTDDTNRFLDLKKVMLDTKKGLRPLEIEGVKFFKKMVILKFKGIESRDEAELLRNMDLLVSREDAIPLEEGEYFICDIIGAEVVTDEDKYLGELKDVLQTGANDVYVVKMENGQEVLIPCIEECVLDVDVESKRVKVHLMKGLL